MKPRKNNRNRKGNEQQQVARLYRNIKGGKPIFERWFVGNEASVSTSAGGVIALQTLANAASVSSTPDFGSMATVYTNYRVKAIRVTLLPTLTAPVYNGATLITQPSVVAVFPSFANTVPTTFQQALDASGLKLMSGYKGGICQTSWMGDPDAHLWTGTGSAIGSNEQFLISCIGTALATTPTTVVFRCIPEYLVQFRITG